ncbi:glycosyltransferase [Vibrio ezurae]|uniref:Spore protein YkvP/CgeB glycosyl transferase-like domain-containing protein n=1 Tax=Vibrio ezurae NBRC 102218 TaxID=1219080 RepID=U3CEF5_9VIBR|nr:glycosyltransferase [Vibrio ezurae]GAD79649.1 hypothetical protein VEZ01S_19_00640 [Vibrio ezurae NBRC 102218]
MFEKFRSNLKNTSEIALVLNWSFHQKNKWVSIFAPYYVNAFIREYNPIIISSQLEYNLLKKKIKYIVSMEPGWAAPKINYDNSLEHKIAFFLSDPHSKKKWLEKYVIDNNVTYVLSQYNAPFFYHFPKFPKNKFIHYPWAVPDEFIYEGNIKCVGNEVIIFGGKKSPAYDVRNWCRDQKNITSFENSGVENKKFSDEEFFQWISQYDAVIAAGSTDPQYDLVTPKYLEIAAVGSLLIGQSCKDLDSLGFNSSNMVIFEKANFNKIIEEYRHNPEKYLKVRENGRQLILDRHLISHRIKEIGELFNMKSNV